MWTRAWNDIIRFYSVSCFSTANILFTHTKKLFDLNILTKLTQLLCQANDISDFPFQQLRAKSYPSQLNSKSYRVRHMLCRRTPMPLKLSLPWILFGVITYLWISARSPSHEQWYHGSNELEFTPKTLPFLTKRCKILYLYIQSCCVAFIYVHKVDKRPIAMFGYKSLGILHSWFIKISFDWPTFFFFNTSFNCENQVSRQSINLNWWTVEKRWWDECPQQSCSCLGSKRFVRIDDCM